MKVTRRELVIGALASPWLLAGCGAGNSGSDGESSDGGGPAPTQWHLEGDSFMAGAGGLRLGDYIATKLGQAVRNEAVGRSTFAEIGDRIVANTALRANPLLIWDGQCNGHVDGSIDKEMDVVASIVSFKQGRRNWLIVPSVEIPGRPNNQAKQEDMLRLRDALISQYGARHVFDALPLLQGLSNGEHKDRSDVGRGLVPRSLLIDKVHLNEQALMAVANALTASGGPMASVLTL